ncbi:DUF3016 domain-containing protein [Alteromonas sediminis]|uniref:DUF3016 domain-containing protein n=1 Tax=Alteromonas sediminis TaxID=2259342 RepID=A0A3N5XY00_9ALTE|nr:DUF3016 domain-containing protein [Alteromonas sediminis]RPJ65987.1 DUF3016 domain-containing protein [Alteromonas sediminis]
MRKLLLVSALSLSTMTSATAIADEKDQTVKNEEGRVLITWQSPQDYSDIRPSLQSRRSFRKQVFRELDEAFEKLAETLPEGQTLHVTVTDIDLAGQVWPASFVGIGSGGEDVRVVKRIHIPRMTFSYVLKDASGNDIKADDVKIKDMGFLDGLSVRFSERPFAYEKRMLKDWFGDTFSEQVAKL